MDIINNDTIKVLSWNLGQPIDEISRKFLPIYASLVNDGMTPPEVMPDIAVLIKEKIPDVVCLQEVRQTNYPLGNGDQLAVLVNSLSEEYYGFMGGGTNGTEESKEHRAILVHTSRLNGEEPVDIANGHGYPIAIAYSLSDPNIWVVNVHLEFANRKYRKTQIESLIDWSNNQNKPILLGGDFNVRCRWASKEQKLFYTNMVADFACAGFEDLSKNIKYTWMSPLLGVQLDFFMGKDVENYIAPSVLPGQTKKLMDHHPIYGEFRVASGKT